MSLPIPDVPLEHICSAIHDNVLYTYSAAAFQALPLTEGAAWEKLPMGESVEGAVCVGTTPSDAAQAAFYVVGGSKAAGAGDSDGSNVDQIPDPCQGGYRGLQKYTYATKQWETICPTAFVTENRKLHGATYIKASNVLLVYAGRQDDSGFMSSQTFTIQAAGDHAVQSFDQAVPPASNPILLPWSDGQAVMVGGDETNRKVTLFEVGAGWTDSGVTIADPLPGRFKAALINGDDASKHLYTFDMTASPNLVNRIVLLDGSGNPVTQSATITPRQLAVDVALSHWEAGGPAAKRDLIYGDWPAYNSSLAPPTTRSDYAIAQDPDGQVVLAGGSSNDDDVLCIFDARTNAWQSASEKLAGPPAAVDDQSVTGVLSVSLPPEILATTMSSTISPTTTSLTMSSSSPTPSETNDEGEISATPVGDANSETSGTRQPQLQEGTGMNHNMILGIALGSILGVALILGIVLFLVRWRQRRKAGHARRDSGTASPEKNGFGFASDILPLTAPAPAGGHFRGHQQSDSQGSYSSIAMLMGGKKNVVSPTANAGQKIGNDSRESRRSSISSLVNWDFKATISNPIAQELSVHPPIVLVEDKAVSFAPDTHSPQPQPPQPRQPPADGRGSSRRSSGWNRYWSGGSLLNTLGVGAGADTSADGVSKRTTVDSEDGGSSSYSDHRATQDSVTMPTPLRLEGRAEINRVHSGNPLVSQPPRQNSMKGSVFGQSERPMSGHSGYSSGIPASVQEEWEPLRTDRPWGSDRAPQPDRGLGGFVPVFLGGSGVAAPPRVASPPRRPIQGFRDDRSQQPQLATATSSSDMSWLNIGSDNGSNSRL